MDLTRFFRITGLVLVFVTAACSPPRSSTAHEH